MPPELIIILALLPFSVAGYAWVLREIARRGGQVATDRLGPPDVVLGTLLAVLYALYGWAIFDAPPKPTQAITVQGVWIGIEMQYVIVMGIAWFISLRKISLVEVLGLRKVGLLQGVAKGVGVLLLAIPLLSFVSLWSNSSAEQPLVTYFREEAKLGHHSNLVVVMITAAILAPIAEEFLFRGYLYPVFKRSAGGGVSSALIVSTIFAVLHGNLSALPGLFALALCLTIAYEWTGSLLVPIAMHACFNSISLIRLYLSALGMNP